MYVAGASGIRMGDLNDVGGCGRLPTGNFHFPTSSCLSDCQTVQAGEAERHSACTGEADT